MKLLDFIFLLRLLCVIMYFMLASQGGFYLLAFAKVMHILPTAHFIELRKVTENFIATPLKILYPSTIIALLIWILIAVKSSGLVSHISLLLAFGLLVTDMVLALKVSIPLNNTIGALTDLSTGEASKVKLEWLKFIVIRGSLSVTGFIFLIMHLLFRSGADTNTI